MCVCVRVYVSSTSLCLKSSHSSAFFAGVDVQESEGDCITEATTPTSFEPVGQSQMSTMELEELSQEEVTSSQEAVSPVDEDTSPAEEVESVEEEAGAADLAQAKEERDSEKTEEPEGDTDSNTQSVDELLADWREDLEAFQQMEKDEL